MGGRKPHEPLGAQDLRNRASLGALAGRGSFAGSGFHLAVHGDGRPKVLLRKGPQPVRIEGLPGVVHERADAETARGRRVLPVFGLSLARSAVLSRTVAVPVPVPVVMVMVVGVPVVMVMGVPVPVVMGVPVPVPVVVPVVMGVPVPVVVPVVMGVPVVVPVVVVVGVTVGLDGGRGPTHLPLHGELR